MALTALANGTRFSGLADRLLDGPEAGGMGRWIHTYHNEVENLREAAQWACRHHDDRALRIAASCTLGWEHTGYPCHGSGVLDDALEVSSDAPAWLVTIARWGVIRSPGGNRAPDPEGDFRRLDEAAAEAGDPFSAALAAWARACESPFAFHVPPDEMTFADVVAMVDRCGRPLYQVMVRLDLGSISSPPRSRPMLSEALDLTRRHGLSEMVGLCDLGIARVCASSGESEAAVIAAHRCLKAVSSLPPGDRETYQAICGFIEAEHGDLELARALLEDASLTTSGPVGTFKVRSALAHVYRLLDLYEECRSAAARALEGHEAGAIDFYDELLFLTLAALDRHDGRPLEAVRMPADRWRVGRRWSGLSDHPQRFIEELAGCARALGRQQVTADLLATAAARRSDEGKPVALNRRPMVEALTSEARGCTLDDQAVQAVADALARGCRRCGRLALSAYRLMLRGQSSS